MGSLRVQFSESDRNSQAWKGAALQKSISGEGGLNYF